MLEYRWQGEGLEKLDEALNKLSNEGQAQRAYRIALNRVGKKAFTQVKRSLSKQVGLSQKKLIDLGNLEAKNSSIKNLEYKISGKGNHISLKEFGARQFGYGVKAKPWGKQNKFQSAFINAGHAGSGKLVGNGHVFIRSTSASLPIRMLYGPAIPKEMIKDDTQEAFEGIAQELQPEIEKTITKITDGVIK